MFALVRFVLAALVLAISLEAGADRRYGLGEIPTPEQIAGWDIDIRPDGVGLPPGEGTALDGERVVTSGGRVLCATALGDTVADAQKNAYECASKIYWEGVFYRKDIGYRAIEREQPTEA